MSDEIEFSEPAKKPAPPVVDANEQELRDQAIHKLEKAQADHQVRKEVGIDDVPKAPESIPKELPKMMFRFGSKVIGCERFQVDDEEARVLAKHMSVLIGSVSSKWYSAIIIVVVVVSKISDCFEKVRELLHGKKQEQVTVEQPAPKGKIYGNGT